MPNEVKLLPFGIGDEVAVIPGCDDWASDWRDVRLWVAGIHALPGGGFEYWVCDTWPLPDKPALTDGFYMGVEGEIDTLSLVTRPTTVVTDEVVERVARAIFDDHNRVYSVSQCKWESDPDHWRRYARAALASMPTVVTGEQPLQSVGDHALPPSGLSPCGSQAKPAAAIAKGEDV